MCGSPHAAPPSATEGAAEERVDGAGRLEAAFTFSSIDAAAMDVLSLGPCIEVVAPVRLRDAVAARALETASLYTDRVAGD